MKKLSIILFAIVACAFTASAQKYALVDMEYILKNIPSYEMANEQLNQVAKRWQKECDDMAAEAETLFKNYQSDMVFLTDEMKTQRADEVKAKE
ncbi:MAG: OmpH family outer membrane protein, partial [Bacteroidaceae bacterium]|nr:OmpH family outer membrane protein [Bacteroidaceae bacterium]